MIKYEDVKLTPDDALNVYIEKYPKTIVKKVKLEFKSNSYIYKVKGYDEEKKYELYIDSLSGAIIETREKLSKRVYKEIAKESIDKIQGLIDKALEDAGENSEIYKWSLELEDGMLELTVKIKLENGEHKEYEYNIDPE